MPRKQHNSCRSRRRRGTAARTILAVSESSTPTPWPVGTRLKANCEYLLAFSDGCAYILECLRDGRVVEVARAFADTSILANSAAGTFNAAQVTTTGSGSS